MEKYYNFPALERNGKQFSVTCKMSLPNNIQFFVNEYQSILLFYFMNILGIHIVFISSENIA